MNTRQLEGVECKKLPAMEAVKVQLGTTSTRYNLGTDFSCPPKPCVASCDSGQSRLASTGTHPWRSRVHQKANCHHRASPRVCLSQNRLIAGSLMDSGEPQLEEEPKEISVSVERASSVVGAQIEETPDAIPEVGQPAEQIALETVDTPQPHDSVQITDSIPDPAVPVERGSQPESLQSQEAKLEKTPRATAQGRQLDGEMQVVRAQAMVRGFLARKTSHQIRE